MMAAIRAHVGAAWRATAGAMRGGVRLLLILLTLAFGLAVCALAAAGAGVFAGAAGRARFDRVAMRWSRVLIALLGARCRHLSVGGAALAPGALLVGNHISWLDTLVLRARWPVVFLAKSEVADWPALGKLAKRAGTLFIERGHGAEQAARDIADSLQRGRSVVLFAEGRTSDGRGVRRFQPRLLQAAIDAGAPVQPVALRYIDRRGRPVTRHSFAVTSLIRGVWRAVSGRAIIAEVTLFAPLAAADRQTLARQAEQLVRAHVEKRAVESAGG